MSEINFRDLQKDDIEIISEMLMEMWLMHAENDGLVCEEKLKNCDVKEYLEIAIQSDNVYAVVAEIENKPVGFSRAEIRKTPSFYTENKELYIDDLVVAPDFRRMGIGNRLVRKAISFAKENEIRLVTSKIYSFNMASEKMFEELGFEQDFTYYSLK